MLKLIFKRILLAIPVLLAVTFITFFLIHSIPGGPFDGEKELPPSVRAQLNKKYGLDQPVFVQYCRYMGKLVSGDLGPSMKYINWDVSELMKEKIKISFELGCYSFIFAISIGLLFGILSGYYHNRWIDKTITFVTTLGICLPALVVGPILVFTFGIWLRVVSVAGWESVSDKILPSLTIGILYASYICRLTRNSILDVLGKQFITAARARGVSEKRIFFVHALKNGLVPVLAYLGPAFAGIITGAIVTESVFQIPGLGRLFLQAITNRDDTVILGVVNFYALAIIICSTVTDCLQILLNPRSKIE